MFVKASCKAQKIVMKNKSGNPNSTNNSLAHPEEMLDNETLQATIRSGHNSRGQVKAQTELMCTMSQVERILNIVKSAIKSMYL